VTTTLSPVPPRRLSDLAAGEFFPFLRGDPPTQPSNTTNQPPGPFVCQNGRHFRARLFEDNDSVSPPSYSSGGNLFFCESPTTPPSWVLVGNAPHAPKHSLLAVSPERDFPEKCSGFPSASSVWLIDGSYFPSPLKFFWGDFSLLFPIARPQQVSLLSPSLHRLPR